MQAWVIWLIAGALLIIAEMATLTFYLLWLGVGALAGGLVAWIWPEAWAGQIFLAVAAAVLLTLFTKPLTHRMREARGFRDAIDELVGKRGTVVEGIPADGLGIVQVGGEVWSAKSTAALPKGAEVIVVNRGNAVIEVEQWRSM